MNVPTLWVMVDAYTDRMLIFIRVILKELNYLGQSSSSSLDEIHISQVCQIIFGILFEIICKILLKANKLEWNKEVYAIFSWYIDL